MRRGTHCLFARASDVDAGWEDGSVPRCRACRPYHRRSVPQRQRPTHGHHCLDSHRAASSPASMAATSSHRDALCAARMHVWSLRHSSSGEARPGNARRGRASPPKGRSLCPKGWRARSWVSFHAYPRSASPALTMAANTVVSEAASLRPGSSRRVQSPRNPFSGADAPSSPLCVPYSALHAGRPHAVAANASPFASVTAGATANPRVTASPDLAVVRHGRGPCEPDPLLTKVKKPEPTTKMMIASSSIEAFILLVVCLSELVEESRRARVLHLPYWVRLCSDWIY
jgi:hypothetical protein